MFQSCRSTATYKNQEAFLVKRNLVTQWPFFFNCNRWYNALGNTSFLKLDEATAFKMKFQAVKSQPLESMDMSVILTDPFTQYP